MWLGLVRAGWVRSGQVDSPGCGQGRWTGVLASTPDRIPRDWGSEHVKVLTDRGRAKGREGQPERQADLRQVQGHSSSWSGHGHLREPAPQAAPGLSNRLSRKHRCRYCKRMPASAHAGVHPWTKARAGFGGDPERKPDGCAPNLRRTRRTAPHGKTCRRRPSP
jgi:hypothetical protein